VRIEPPALAAGLRIERDHDISGGLEVQQAESEHRCRFEGELSGAGESCAQLTRAVRPRRRELRDVAAVDLVEAGKVLPERITAVKAPIARARRLRAGAACGGDERQGHEHARTVGRHAQHYP